MIYAPYIGNTTGISAMTTELQESGYPFPVSVPEVFDFLGLKTQISVTGTLYLRSTGPSIDYTVKRYQTNLNETFVKPTSGSIAGTWYLSGELTLDEISYNFSAGGDTYNGNLVFSETTVTFDTTSRETVITVTGSGTKTDNLTGDVESYTSNGSFTIGVLPNLYLNSQSATHTIDGDTFTGITPAFISNTFMSLPSSDQLSISYGDGVVAVDTLTLGNAATVQDAIDEATLTLTTNDNASRAEEVFFNASIFSSTYTYRTIEFSLATSSDTETLTATGNRYIGFTLTEDGVDSNNITTVTTQSFSAENYVDVGADLVDTLPTKFLSVTLESALIEYTVSETLTSLTGHPYEIESRALAGSSFFLNNWSKEYVADTLQIRFGEDTYIEGEPLTGEELWPYIRVKANSGLWSTLNATGLAQLGTVSLPHSKLANVFNVVLATYYANNSKTFPASYAPNLTISFV